MSARAASEALYGGLFEQWRSAVQQARPKAQVAARAAATAMVDPRSTLGVARRDSEGLWLEEYPGSAMPAVLNASNEAAVEGFLDGRMPFSGIWKTVDAVMGRHRMIKTPSLDDIIDADRSARAEAWKLIEKQ